MGTALERRLSAAWSSGAADFAPAGAAGEIMVGLQALPAGAAYEWRGRRRSVRGRGHEAIIQVTLGGWGRFGDGRARPVRCLPGTLFATTTPSDHHYLLPPESPGWRIWWVQIAHPWVVERLRRSLARGPAVAALPDGHALVDALLRCTALVRRGDADAVELEEAAVAVVFAHARLLRDRDEDGGGRVLADLRMEVLADPARTPAVEDLARRAGRSPTSYGHWFRHLTGITPGRFLIQVRLEAARQLVRQGLPQQEVARRCGFADATHFGKAFRRHLGLSPGAWRRQASGG